MLFESKLFALLGILLTSWRSFDCVKFYFGLQNSKLYSLKCVFFYFNLYFSRFQRRFYAVFELCYSSGSVSCVKYIVWLHNLKLVLVYKILKTSCCNFVMLLVFII